MNGSQEQPLANDTHQDNSLLPKNKQIKRRIFSSAGGRKPGLAKNRNRLQTAKYSNPVSKVAYNRWKGGSQQNKRTRKGKSSTQSKYSENKAKNVPLNEYNWPEDKEPTNNGRPVTAKKYNNAQIARTQTNYDAKRQNIQSRGRVNATGLSGTSQSSQLKEGLLIIINKYRNK